MRSYGRDDQILDPLHYLAILGRRPAALDHAPVLRNWQLPASFTRLRQTLEAGHGARAGARQYIRVLQLLAEHPLGRVQQAVEQGLRQAPVQAERIIALPLREARELFERQYLLAQVTRFGGNISRTANFVGMERSALHRKLKSLGVHGADRPGVLDS